MSDYREISPGYYALFLAVEQNLPAQAAIDYIEQGKPITRRRGEVRTDTLEMAQLKRMGWRLREIGERFGLSASGVNQRIRRYEKKSPG
jgi:hypothetical protein